MKSTPSPRVRFLAVLALILLAAAGAYVLMRGSNSTSNTAGTQATLQTTTHTQTTPAKPNTKPEKKSKKSARKGPVEGINALDAALVAHPLVVVSVYARNVATDDQAMREARVGAARVGAGFVAFNVFDEKIARQLASLINDDATSNPEVLFFKRGRKLVFRLEGFADSQVVAQAARNAYPVTEPWVNDANRICGRFMVPFATAIGKSKGADLTTAVGREKTVVALNEVAALLNKVTKSLSAIRPNVSAANDYAQFISDLRQLATDMGSEAVALHKNDQQTGAAIAQKEKTLAETASGLAASLEITTCSP
jgi:hypothetical protein